MAGWIEVLFVVDTFGDPRYMILDGVPTPNLHTVKGHVPPSYSGLLFSVNMVA